MACNHRAELCAELEVSEALAFHHGVQSWRELESEALKIFKRPISKIRFRLTQAPVSVESRRAPAMKRAGRGIKAPSKPPRRADFKQFPAPDVNEPTGTLTYYA
jgi:hypothetical protein